MKWIKNTENIYHIKCDNRILMVFNVVNQLWEWRIIEINNGNKSLIKSKQTKGFQNAKNECITYYNFITPNHYGK